MVDKPKKKETKFRKSYKELDSSKYIDIEPTLKEATKKAVVVSFGRFNPITVGHEKLANRVISEAAKRRADAAIYMSHSQDPKKNPLTYDQKISLGQKAFGKAVKRSNARTLIEVAKELSGKYSELIIVVGADRIREFETLMNKYNGKEYSFENIEIVSAGDRDPDADDVTGMSASKMRALASEGDYDSFKKGLPKRLQSSAQSVYDMVRAGMNIAEKVNEENLVEREPLSIAQRRQRGLVMKRYRSKIKAARERAKRKMAPKEKLLKRSRKKALEFIRDRLMKNKKYSEMTPSEKIALDKRLQKISPRVIDRIAKKIFPKVRQAEKERLAQVLSHKQESINAVFESFFESKIVKPQDPDVSHLPGSQPKGYYAGVKKSVKDDRARHFAKYAKKSDDEQSSYKPAPGDEGAKTKPSVHTKKFKQMFGEASCADTKVRKRPHMALEKNGSVKFDKRFKMYRSKNEITEDIEDLTEDLANLMLDMDAFIMSEEFDTLMESNPEEALKKKAEKTGISYGILKKVFDRGVAAWRTGHRPGTTPTQWGLARVNSFATKGKGTWGKADSDLAAKVRSEAVSPTAVHPFVHVKDPNKAVKVSPSLKHKLGVGLSMKHMMQHGIKAVDRDNDGDVDAFEKTTPDEITGTEKKNLTKVMQKKLSGEVKHTRVGHAFESSVMSIDDLFELRRLDESVALSKVLEKMHKYVMQGMDPGQIAADISTMVAGVGSPRQLEKAYADAYGSPKKKTVGSGDQLRKKYGFKAEGTETAKAKMKISQEKIADARKHDRMLDAAKSRDAAAKKNLKRSISESNPNPSKREEGTDSLVNTYKKDTPGEKKKLKEESPLMKDLPRGSRVRFIYRTMVGDNDEIEGTVVGAWENDEGETIKQGLRVRDDQGRLYNVKHSDAEKIE